MTPWSVAELDRLKALSAKGLSAGQIAGRLCREFGTGRSRNAVIGKLMRGKGQFGQLHMLPRGGSARAPGMEKKISGRAASPRARKAGAASPHKAAPAAVSTRSRPSAPAALAYADAPEKSGGLRSEPRALPEAVAKLPAPLPMGFEAAVDAGRCLYFVGDPYGSSGHDMPVCGAERAAFAPRGNRYCRRHMLGQYQARAAA
jgi:GcrA cell cycle regulator